MNIRGRRLDIVKGHGGRIGSGDDSNGDDSRALTARTRVRESIARIMLKAEKDRVRSACEWNRGKE